MIKMSRLNGQEFYINSDLIEMIETTPDTVITMLNGKKLIVSESVDEVVERIVHFKARIQRMAKIG